jgi:hypothetical protein
MQKLIPRGVGCDQPIRLSILAPHYHIPVHRGILHFTSGHKAVDR